MRDIARHGAFRIALLCASVGYAIMILAGGVLLIGAITVGASGETFSQYWGALVLLGVGWNFMFVGGSTLLTYTHTPEERGKVQGINDLTVFSLVAIGSLSSGALLHYIGWAGLNLAMLPLIIVALIGVIGFHLRGDLRHI